jgi:DNA repair protein RadC
LEKHSSERIRRSSRADIDMTKAIVEVARPLGISVHDHLIVGKDGHARCETAALPC